MSQQLHATGSLGRNSRYARVNRQDMPQIQSPAIDAANAAHQAALETPSERAAWGSRVPYYGRKDVEAVRIADRDLAMS
jgi:hypothetical protein